MKVNTAELLIEPIGYCNLACKYCYTRHTRDIIPPDQLLDFIERYFACVNHERVRITWLGRGEVTLYPNLAHIINQINHKFGPRISHYMQTNGILIDTIVDRLERIDNLEVSMSLDGFEAANDENRGAGTFQKILKNVQYVALKGISLRIQSILKPDNYLHAQDFTRMIASISPKIPVGFFPLLTRDDIKKFQPNRSKFYEDPVDQHAMDVMREKIASEEFNFLWNVPMNDDIYLCLTCDGFVFSCCEFQFQIGDIHSDMHKLLEHLNVEACVNCSAYRSCYPNIKTTPVKVPVPEITVAHSRSIVKNFL